MAVKEPTPTKRPKAPEIAEKARFKEEKPSPFSIEGIRRGAVASNIVKVFLVASGLIMAGGFIVSSLTPAPELSGQGAVPGANTTIAQVGTRAISGAQLADIMDRQEQFGRQFGQTTTAASYLDSKKAALQSLTDNAAVIEAAKKSGVEVTDADVEAKINELIAQDLKPQPGQTEAAFRRLIETRYGSMDKAKAEILGGITQEQRDGIRDSLYVEKLQKQVEAQNKVTEDDYKRSVTKLDLYQIAVQPPLPKAGAAPDEKTSEAAARAEADKIAAQLKANPTLANFKTLAQKESDDPLTKPKGGALGFKLPAELGPEIGDVLAQAPGPIVGPLSNPGGAQSLFFIAGRKTELPKDYAKNKKTLLAEFEKAEDAKAWSKRQEELKKSVDAQISDPAILAYSATQQNPDFFKKSPEEQKKARAAAIAQYQSALPNASPIEAAAINLQMAQLYGAQGNKPGQLAALKAATEKEPNDASLRLEYARALRDAGQPKVALAELKAASQRLDEAPSAPTMFGNPDDATRQQLAAEFGLLKEPKLAEAERAKIKPAQMPGGMGGLGGLPPGVQIMPGGGQ